MDLLGVIEMCCKYIYVCMYYLCLMVGVIGAKLNKYLYQKKLFHVPFGVVYNNAASLENTDMGNYVWQFLLHRPIVRNKYV